MKSVIPLKMSKVILIISRFVFSWFSGKLRIPSTSGEPPFSYGRGRGRASASGGQINEQKEVIITEATAKHRSGASTEMKSLSQSDSSPPRGVLDPFVPFGLERIPIPMEERRGLWSAKGDIHREMHINVRCRDIQKVDQSVACIEYMRNMDGQKYFKLQKLLSVG